jgi:hypothetical protein
METLQRNNLWKLYSAIIYGNSTARLVVPQGERVTRRSPKEHHVGISDLMGRLGLGAGVAVRGGERDGGSQGYGGIAQGRGGPHDATAPPPSHSRSTD